MMTEISFPQLGARDLDGHEVTLPAGLPGEWNVVIVAFLRQQQELVDSWVPWLEDRAAATPWLRFAELPAIGLQWRAARPARRRDANMKAIEAAGLSFILGMKVPDVPYIVGEWRRQHPGEEIPDGHVFTQPWPAGPKDKRRDQVIYYTYKADRARRTLRGTGEQVAKAAKAVAGLAPVKRNRFIALDGAAKSVNRDLEAKARARPVYHRKRDSIEARLTIVFAALAVSRWIEARTGWPIRKFVTTARRYRTIQTQAGRQTITAADPLSDDLRQALEAITRAGQRTRVGPTQCAPD